VLLRMAQQVGDRAWSCADVVVLEENPIPDRGQRTEEPRLAAQVPWGLNQACVVEWLGERLIVVPDQDFIGRARAGSQSFDQDREIRFTRCKKVRDDNGERRRGGHRDREYRSTGIVRS